MKRVAMLLLVCVLAVQAMAQDKPLTEYQAARKAYDDAYALMRAKEYGKAVAAFEAVAEQYPNYDLADDALNLAAGAAGYDKNYEKQMALFKRLTEEYPTSNYAANATFSLANTLYSRFKKYSEAAEIFEAAGTKFPGYTNSEYALSMVVYCRRNAKEYDKVVAAVDAAATQMPQTGTRYVIMLDAKIEALTQLGQYDQAKIACEQFAELAKIDYRVGQRYDYIARNLYSAKKYAEAAEYYRLASKVPAYQDANEAIFRAGQSLERTNPPSTEAAISVYQELADTFPNDDRSQDVLLRIGQLQATVLKDREAEVATLRKFVEKYPKSIMADLAQYRLVTALNALKKGDEVVAAAEALVKSYPKSEYCDDALWMAAEVCRAAKQDDKMKEFCQKIVDDYPGHGRIDAARGRLQ